jgi:hypothetical protein
MAKPASPPRPRRRSNALIDALHYPARAPAWICNAVFVFGHVIAASLPISGWPVHALLMLAFYRYAFDAMAASAEGRDDPPEIINSAEAPIHRRHLLLQLAWLALLAAAPFFLDKSVARLLLIGLAVVVPGALIALLVAQNLVAALDPRSWWIVANRIGPGYVALALVAMAVLAYPLAASHLPESAGWRLAAVAVFHGLGQHLLLAWFRAMGLGVRANARALGYAPDVDARPALQRDREQAARSIEHRAALALVEPGARADALGRLLEQGGDERLHQEYRRCLRQCGRHDALRRHAATHACELVALGQVRPALALVFEALQDDPYFTLPDAIAIATLIEAGERTGMLRPVVALAANYHRAWPKRYDGLPLLRRAAILLADRLADPERAAALLAQGLAMAGNHADAADFTSLQKRLAIGATLGAPATADRPPAGR